MGDKAFEQWLLEGLRSMRTASGGLMVGVICYAIATRAALSELEKLLLGICGWLASTLAIALVVGLLRDRQLVRDVAAQTSSERTELINQLHSFADEGTDQLVAKPVSIAEVPLQRTYLHDWKRRFQEYLDGRILVSEYRGLARLDTFRLRGLAGVNAEDAHIREMAAEWVARLRALADRIEEGRSLITKP